MEKDAKYRINGCYRKRDFWSAFEGPMASLSGFRGYLYISFATSQIPVNFVGLSKQSAIVLNKLVRMLSWRSFSILTHSFSHFLPHLFCLIEPTF